MLEADRRRWRAAPCRSKAGAPTQSDAQVCVRWSLATSDYFQRPPAAGTWRSTAAGGRVLRNRRVRCHSSTPSRAELGDLLIVECHHRINLRRAPCGDVTCEESHCHESQQGTKKCWRISWPNS